MGSVAKVIKKVARVAKKPFSKITKGIARGIAKVGKAVMRGVGKISNKLGPIGMIGLAIAMPYALTALGGGTTGGLIGGAWSPAGTTGWMGSKNVFLRSIGNVGNQIRTGYQAVSKTFSGITRGITDSISEGFSSMGKGNNIFSRISNGAKELFRNARLTSKQMGTVDVKGWGGPFDYMQGNVSQMTSGQAMGLLDAGAIEGGQLSAQTFGKTNWLTKTNRMDKAVTETINKTYKENIMSNWSPNAKTAFSHYEKAAINSGEQFNYQQIDKMMRPNLDFSGPANKYTDFNFAKSGDFAPKIGTGVGPRGEYGLTTEDYQFTGNKTFKVNGKSTLEKIKSAAKGKALDTLQASLLKPSEKIIPDIDWSLMGDTTQQTEGATTYGGTNIFGSKGGSLLEGVFNKDQQERILNYYRHMNIVGSH